MQSGAVAVAAQLTGFHAGFTAHLDSLRGGLEAVRSLAEGPRRIAQAFQDIVQPAHLTFMALKVDLEPLLPFIRALAQPRACELFAQTMLETKEMELPPAESSVEVLPTASSIPARERATATVIGITIDLTLETPYLLSLPADAKLLDQNIAIQSEGGSMLYFRSQYGWFPERVKPQAITLIRELWKIRLSGASHPYQRLTDLGKVISEAMTPRTIRTTASNRIREVQRLCTKHGFDKMAIFQKSAGRWGLNPNLSYWKQESTYGLVHRNVHQCSPGTESKRLR